MREAVQIRGLSYRYRSQWLGKPVAALHPFDLSIPEGTAFGFLGHNGAGKTTTIKCILNLIRPTAGTISIFGHDSRSLSARAHVGYLPEQPYFYDHLTVREILAMYGRLANVHSDELACRVQEGIETLKLQSKADAPMRALSKGLTQRVALAQALIARPKLLILDEPFSGLDPVGRAEFREHFLRCKREGATLFISSHVLSDVEFLCDQVSIMAAGKLRGVYRIADVPRLTGASYQLQLSGSPEQLHKVSSEHLAEHGLLRLRFSDQQQAQAALRRALDAGVTVESFALEQGKLEDLFLSVIQSASAEQER